MSAFLINIGLHFLNVIDSQSILTQQYGSSGGGQLSQALDQGRINAIHEWGYGLQDLCIRNWTSDSQTIFDLYGDSATYTQCTSFQLSSDDFIVGYQTYYTLDIVGLDLYTRDMHSCIGPDIAAATTSPITLYNYSIDDFYYLSGWIIKSGSVIDNIQFQFTKATQSPTNNPTVDPTPGPSLNPSEDPSISPSKSPSTEPTIDPIRDPTEIPTVDPRIFRLSIQRIFHHLIQQMPHQEISQ